MPALVHAQRTQQCAQMAQQKLPGLAMEIVKAEWRDAAPATAAQPAANGRPPAPARPALPAYCYVEGMLDRRTGVAGKAYGIRFALSLPDSWNNNFLMQGGGGLNGTLGLPTGAQATGGNSALARGFAVASTDTGHQSSGGGFDGAFLSDQQAALDFEFVAIGRIADLSKQLVAAYYGSAARHSYFIGCSTGGREAMLMTQRYPTYFDGVVAGAPAQRTGFSNLADKYITVLLNAVAPKDDAGRPVTAQALSATDKKLVIDSILKACDEKDGIKDGMIFNTRGCNFDPESLTCKAAKDDTCLSAAQAAAIKKGFAGPKNTRGQAVYAGWLYDTGNAASGGGIPGLLNPGPSPVGSPTVQTTMDVDAEAAVIAANPTSIIGDSASWVNLNTFSGRGGKLIFYHGNSDPWFSALDTIGYYDRLAQANGGASKVDEWSRVFLVPGMGHCQGGTGALDSFDMLAPLTRWVEQGQAPDSVIATGRAFPGRSRPLCAYPKHAQYKGTGDPQDAANFSCTE